MRFVTRGASTSQATKGRSRACLAAACLTFFVGLTTAGSWAVAATTVYTGVSGGGVFNDDDNWSLASPGDNLDPDGLDDLGIFNSATNVDGTITFDADATHFRTFVQNTSGTIAFDTGNFKWTMTGFFLTGTAVTEQNHIQLINGEVQSEIILLGNTAGSTNPNVIEVIGPTALWHTTTTGGGFRVGSGGSANSQFIVRDGGTITGNGQIIIGLVSSAGGLMRVTGEGSTATVAGSIQVGGGNSAQSENNRLEVLDSGHVTGGQLLMGVTEFADNNTTLVSGAGSTLTITGAGRSDIGRVGAGHTLQIDDSGTVDGLANYTLGVEADSTGNQILVNGSGASLTGTGVDARRGTLSVNGGAVILNDIFDAENEVYDGGVLLANVGASSVIELNSGSISAIHANIANGSPFTVGDGGAESATYHMKKVGDGSNGTHTFADGLSLSSNAILSGSGNIVGSVSGSAGAQIDVGASPGVINVDGSWNNTGLNVGLEVGNLALVPAQAGVGYDLLNVSGPFSHGGTVNIDVSGFAAGSGFVQDLKLIGWSSEVGSSAATGVSFVGGPALPFQIRSDGLYLTDVSFSIIPEPSTIAMFAIGLILFGVGQRRKFHQLR